MKWEEKPELREFIQRMKKYGEETAHITQQEKAGRFLKEHCENVRIAFEEEKLRRAKAFENYKP